MWTGESLRAASSSPSRHVRSRLRQICNLIHWRRAASGLRGLRVFRHGITSVLTRRGLHAVGRQPPLNLHHRLGELFYPEGIGKATDLEEEGEVPAPADH